MHRPLSIFYCIVVSVPAGERTDCAKVANMVDRTTTCRAYCGNCYSGSAEFFKPQEAASSLSINGINPFS